MPIRRIFITSFAKPGIERRTFRFPGSVTRLVVTTFTNRPKRRGLKRLLAWLAASSAALAMAPQMALAAPLDPLDPRTSQCSTSDTVITCGGNLSRGINYVARGGLYDKLILQDILPNGSDPGFISPGNFNGIQFSTDESFAIENSAQDPFTIKQSSNESFVHGIVLSGIPGDTGTLSLSTHGSIETTGSSNNHGMLITGNDHVIDVEHVGDISLQGTGTFAFWVGNYGAGEAEFGSISIFHDGAISGAGEWNRGFFVDWVHGSDVSITKRGHITFESSSSSDLSIGFIVVGRPGTNFGDGTVNVAFVGDFRSVTEADSIAKVVELDIGALSTDPTTANVNFQQIGDIDIVNHTSQSAIDIKHRSGHATVDYTGTLRLHGASDGVGILVDARRVGGTVEIQLGYEGTGYDNQLWSGAVIVAPHNGVQLSSTGSASNHVGLHNDVIIWGNSTDIKGGGGEDTVNNHGIFSSVNGIELQGGANFLNNHNGATFNSGSTIDLGTSNLDDDVEVLVDADGKMVRTYSDGEVVPPGWSRDTRRGNTLYNYGIFSPRGEVYEEIFLPDYAETIADESQTFAVTAGLGTTQLTGNYIQAGTGAFMVNVNTTTGESDTLEILGDGIAVLAGRLIVLPNVELDTDINRYIILTVEDRTISGELRIPELSPYAVEFFDDRIEAYYVELEEEEEEEEEEEAGEDGGDEEIVDKPHFACKDDGSNNQEAVSCVGIASLPLDNRILEEIRYLLSDELKAAYADLTGEVHASLSGVLMESSLGRSDAVLTRLNMSAHRPEGDSFALLHDTRVRTDARSDLSWWIKGQGGVLSRDANEEFGTAELDHEEAGLIIGTDFNNEDWTIGFTFGWSQGTTEVDDRRSEGDTQTWSLGMYGGTSIDSGEVPVNFSFGAFANFHAIETDRTVAFWQLNEALNADYDASSFQAFAEVASNLELNASATVFQPFINVTHVALDTDGYSESLVGEGVSHAALQVDDSNQSLFSTKLGLRASTDIPSGSEISNIRLFGELGWRFNFGDVEPESQVAFIGGDPFTITGAPVSENAFSGQVGIAAELGHGIFVQASYRSEIGEESEAHSVNAGLIGRF